MNLADIEKSSNEQRLKDRLAKRRKAQEDRLREKQEHFDENNEEIDPLMMEDQDEEAYKQTLIAEAKQEEMQNEFEK